MKLCPPQMIKFIIEYRPKGETNIRFAPCYGENFVDALAAFRYENSGCAILNVLFTNR